MFFLWLTLSLFCTDASAKQHREPLKIAIVDTGLNLFDPRFKGHICPGGHKDFTNTGLNDFIGHGTFVAGLIQKYAGKTNDYCFLIYKYYTYRTPAKVIIRGEVDAFREAIKNGAKIINFSGGGETFSEDEYLVVKENPDVLFVVAAGNESKNIETETGHFYPASLLMNNEQVVGNITSDGKQAETSNWANPGRERFFWEIGTDVKSILPNGNTGIESGTSFSTAIRTGKVIRDFLDATK